ncbi:hypothetical protein SLS63_012188 [Diaporthe eres]|uniref:NADP-dependent oxidoreductase domain-containing protein n=1 Tax=Diaporthe eres TaxID=83184 RepID=A0ABR1NRY3_DIAER
MSQSQEQSSLPSNVPAILITGAFSGLGRAFFEHFATGSLKKLSRGQAQDFKVVGIDRQPWLDQDGKPQLSHVHGPRSIYVQADITSPRHELEALLRKWIGEESPLTLVVHSAGVRGLVFGVELHKSDDVAAAETLDVMDAATMMSTFEVNAVGTFNILTAVLPSLRLAAARGLNPKVAVMSSRNGSIAANDKGGAYAYRASKAALNAVVKSMSIDVPEVCFALLHPGRVETGLVSVKEDGAITCEESLETIYSLQSLILTMSPTKLIFGAGLFTKDQGCNSVDDFKPWLDALVESKHLFDEIDTSAMYQQSEEYLGHLNFGAHFGIGTKLPGQFGLPATKETVIAQAKASLSKLGVEKVDILYMHAPDTRMPLEETVSGFDALYREGTIKRFGLSNYTPEQVEEVVKVCHDKGFVLPSVFQGSYSAVARLAEDKLLPILRKHGISFYAYSPIAGGFLAKTPQQFRDDSFQGQWEKSNFLGKCYHLMYNRPNALEALDRWHEIAEAEDISGVEMAFRWVVHNSALDGSLGDGVVIGASTTEQWKGNLAAIQKGPLSSEANAKIDSLWGPLKSESYYSNLDVVTEIMAAAAK